MSSAHRVWFKLFCCETFSRQMCLQNKNFLIKIWWMMRPTLNYFKSTIMADSVDPSQSDPVLQFGLNMVLRNIWLKHLAWPMWSYVTVDLKRRHHICRLPYLSEFQDQIRNDWIPRFFSYITHHSGAGDTFDVSMSSPKKSSWKMKTVWRS